MKARIFNVTVSQLPIGMTGANGPRHIDGDWSAELVITTPDGMTMEEAMDHMRDRTEFELIPVDDDAG